MHNHISLDLIKNSAISPYLLDFRFDRVFHVSDLQKLDS